MQKPKVHLIGGDGQNWALDMDLRLTKEALTGVVEFVDSPNKADAVHSVCVEQLVIDPRVRANIVKNKFVVAHFTSTPEALFEQVPTLYKECKNWVCVAQTRQVFEQLQSLKLPIVRFIPYVGDLKNFYPIAATDSDLQKLRSDLALPLKSSNGKYIIGSFQRDSLGSNLLQPKIQKGPDIFLEILVGVQKRVGPGRIHVLLAGPRRHWLRSKLEENGISYSFDGDITLGDDYPKNIVSLQRINQLTNLLDLYIIGSRWEGAPQAAFETVACKKKIISTNIAVPRDAFSLECLFDDIPSAVDLVVADIERHSLASTVDVNYKKVFENHSVEEVRKHWIALYGELAAAQTNTGAVNAGAVLRTPTVSGLLLLDHLPSVLVDPIRSQSLLLEKAVQSFKKIAKAIAPKKQILIWTRNDAFLKAVPISEFDRRKILVAVNPPHLESVLGHIFSPDLLTDDAAFESRIGLFGSMGSDLNIIQFVAALPKQISAGYEKNFKWSQKFARFLAFDSYESWVAHAALGGECEADCTILKIPQATKAKYTIYNYERSEKDIADQILNMLESC